jgi:hypothetical protein
VGYFPDCEVGCSTASYSSSGRLGIEDVVLTVTTACEDEESQYWHATGIYDATANYAGSSEGYWQLTAAWCNTNITRTHFDTVLVQVVLK